MTENEISKILVDIFVRIHTRLGPGLLESVYETVLCYELKRANLEFQRQQSMHLIYDHMIMDIGFRADVIIEKKVIIEIKSVETIAPVHFKTLLTYLRLSDKKLGLLVNFNVDLIKNGITRVVNGL